MHETRAFLMTAAAGALALAIAAPAMAQSTTPPPQGEHHGMAMEGHSDMLGSAKPETKSGVEEQRTGSTAESCEHMMEGMSRSTPPPAEPSEPKSKPGGC